MKLSRLTVALGAAAVLVTTFASQPGSADPVVAHGKVGVKGPGASYSVAVGNAPALAVATVAKGATAAFSLQVTNNGTVAATYAISLTPRTGSPELVPANGAVYAAGLLSSKALPIGTYGYTTPSIAAGRSSVFQVKVPMPKTAPDGHAWLDLTLRTPDGTVQGTAQLVAEQKATGAGTTSHDMTITGPSGAVGSSAYQALTSTAALTGTQTGTFTIKVTNNSSHTVYAILVDASYPPYCEQFRVGNAFSPLDQTHPWQGSYWVTKTLKPHQSESKQVTMSRPIANCLAAPAIPNLVEIRAREDILGQNPGSEPANTVVLVAPYAS